MLIAAAVSRWPCFRADVDRRSLPPLCVLAGAVGPHFLVFGSVVGWMLDAIAIVFGASGGPLTSEQDVRVCRGRFCDVTLRLWRRACSRIVALLFALSWVAVRGMLVWYVGVLTLKVGSCGRDRPQDVEFALRLRR